MENQIRKHIEANTPIIWVNTHEYERVIAEISKTNSQVNPQKETRVWSITKGINAVGKELPEKEKEIIQQLQDIDPLPPVVALNYIQSENLELTAIILLDFHRFLPDIEISRKLLDAYEKVKETFNQIIIVSPVIEIPPEIEKYITVVDLPLPDEKDLEERLKEIIEANEGLLDPKFEEEIENNPQILRKLARAGKGLTLNEFENAVTVSISSKEKIDIKDIFEQKKQLVKKTSGLEIFDPEEIDEVKGLERAKEYIIKAINSEIGKGALLVGIPGTGKSLLAKQIGKMTNLPTIVLDIGSIFGSLVGESERKISHALKTVEAMAPCILFIDELEKGLSGINSSDRTDGGTGSRVFGKFLTWLNDKNSGVYVIATANDLSKLPPEFLRSGRWNWIFFVDLPTEEERKEILKYYCEKYKVPYEEIDTDGYTGAEIKAIVENALILQCSLEEAKKAVIPISKTRKEDIERLRNEARNRFIPASYSQNETKNNNSKTKKEKPKARRVKPLL